MVAYESATSEEMLKGVTYSENKRKSIELWWANKKRPIKGWRVNWPGQGNFS